MDAVAKLGGLNTKESKAQGVDKQHFKDKPGRRNPFKANGLSFDAMAEALDQHGYKTAKEGYDANSLLDLVLTELSGDKQYSQSQRLDIANAELEANGEGFTAPQTQKAIKKALAGQELGIREARAITGLLNDISAKRSEQVPDALDLLGNARTERRAIRNGADPISVYEEYADHLTGDLYEESYYEPELTAHTRSMVELIDEADAHGVPEDVRDTILEGKGSDAEIATALYKAIGEHDGTRSDSSAEVSTEQEGKAPAKADTGTKGKATGDAGIDAGTTGGVSKKPVQGQVSPAEVATTEGKKEAKSPKQDTIVGPVDMFGDDAIQAGKVKEKQKEEEAKQKDKDAAKKADKVSKMSDGPLFEQDQVDVEESKPPKQVKSQVTPATKPGKLTQPKTKTQALRNRANH